MSESAEMGKRPEFPATEAMFKEYFFRDFPYSDNLDGVMDRDIAKAFAEAMFYYNPALFDEKERPLAFMYAAAHCLATALRNSSAGINADGAAYMASKGAGSVSASYAIPQWVMENPVYGQMAQTAYGAKYLSMASARCVGGFALISGATSP